MFTTVEACKNYKLVNDLSNLSKICNANWRVKISNSME